MNDRLYTKTAPKVSMHKRNEGMVYNKKGHLKEWKNLGTGEDITTIIGHPSVSEARICPKCDGPKSAYAPCCEKCEAK